MREKSMKVFLFIALFLFVSSAFLIPGLRGNHATSANGQEGPEASKKEQIPSPFPHLDKLYPPQAQAPVLLIEMLKLSMLFTSVGYDAAQNDWENSQRGFENFKGQMIKLSGMIPKWKDYFKMVLVGELGRAVAQKDVPAIGRVNREIANNICGACHNEYRSQVWHRYHWKDFGKIMVDDPVSKRKFPYRVFMIQVADSWDGIEIDMQQNQPANAQKAFKAFTARLGALKKVCGDCHDPKQGEMRHYISSDIMEMIDDLGAEISKPKPAQDKMEGLFRGIGQGMCYKCHQVHQPAAVVQNFWRTHLGGQK